MMVAMRAAGAAAGLAGLGLVIKMAEGDAFIAASAESCLFVATLVWSLTEIGERIGPCRLAEKAQAERALSEAAEPMPAAGAVSTSPTWQSRSRRLVPSALADRRSVGCVKSPYAEPG